MEKKTRSLAIVSGRVQGVFFREETKREARRCGVAGWVKNRPDGTVEAEFEGDKKNVNSMISWLRRGSPLSDVEGVDIKWKDYTGDLGKFCIRN